MVGEATAEATVVALGPEDPVPRAWTDIESEFYSEHQSYPRLQALVWLD